VLQANINVLTTKIAELVRQSEKLGEDGDVDGSVAAAAQADTLKVQAGSVMHVPLCSADAPDSLQGATLCSTHNTLRVCCAKRCVATPCLQAARHRAGPA
jgi:hypothetical protein